MKRLDVTDSVSPSVSAAPIWTRTFASSSRLPRSTAAGISLLDL